jgi:hypothetical protein
MNSENPLTFICPYKLLKLYDKTISNDVQNLMLSPTSVMTVDHIDADLELLNQKSFI